MLRLIKLCLRYMLGGDSVIFHAEACLPFCVWLQKMTFYLKMAVVVRGWW